MKFRLIRSNSNIVYHGSKNDFIKFDTSFLGTNDGCNWYGVGFHFCDSKDYILENYSKNGFIYTCEILGSDSTLDLFAKIGNQPSSTKLIQLCNDYELDIESKRGFELPQALSRKLGYPKGQTYLDIKIRKHFQSILSQYGIEVMKWEEGINIYVVWNADKVKILDKQRVDSLI